MAGQVMSSPRKCLTFLSRDIGERDAAFPRVVQAMGFTAVSPILVEAVKRGWRWGAPQEAQSELSGAERWWGKAMPWTSQG